MDLKKLLADCREDGMRDIHLKIKAFVDAQDAEGLLEITEMSEEPIFVKMSMPRDETLRAAATQVLEDWLLTELEHDLVNQPYGEYMEIVDNWLSDNKHEETSEAEMAVVDELQCDLTLPHVCARGILEIRNEKK